MVLFVITIFIFLMIVGLVYNFFFKNIEGITTFNPTCSGSGWTDPNPASHGRRFRCDGKGNYLAAPGGYCPANFQNKNGTCVNPSAPPASAPAPFTPTCSGSGWTDPNPASNGRHFDCDGKGNYLAAPGGYCPANFQNKNGTCADPSAIPPPFTLSCFGNGWTDPNPASNGRHFECDGKGNYLAAPGGYCPANYQNKNGTCVDPNSSSGSFISSCSGSGWTDPNPASNGRHFSCDPKGNYLAAAGGYCPANYQNKNGTCFNPGS